MRGSVSWLSRDLAGRRNRATIGFSDTPFQTESPPVGVVSGCSRVSCAKMGITLLWSVWCGV